MDGNFDVVLSKRFMRKMFWVHLRKSKQHAMSFGPHRYTTGKIENIARTTPETRKLCYRKDDRAMRTIQVDREPLRRYGHLKLSKMAAATILFESKIAPLDPPSPKTKHVPYKPSPITKHEVDRMTGCGDGHLKYKIFQHGGGRHLGFVRTGNSAIRSAVPENPTLEQNMKCIG